MNRKFYKVKILAAYSFSVLLFINFISYASASDNSEKINFNYILNLAVQKAKTTYTPNTIQIPKQVTSATYSHMQQVQYNKDKGLWKNNKYSYYLAFMPMVGNYNLAVNFYEVDDGKSKKIQFNADNFNYGNSKIPPASLPKAYSGFQILSSKTNDPLLIFQGASYFRPVPPGATFGLSLRAISLNTVLENAAEEFPDFTDFWIVKPDNNSSELTFYALLNGKSVTGAYEFKLTCDKIMKLNIKSTIILKSHVSQVGFAPITSLFWYDKNTHFNFGQYRPEDHNSDGLIMSGDKVYYWQPLVNYVGKAAIDSYRHFKKLNYFGLLQRNRKFTSYVDWHNRYYLDANVWIEPEIETGPGNVRLVTLPTNIEFTDNVNTFWIPDNKPEVGKPYNFNYTINCSLETPPETTAHVNNYWHGKFYSKDKTFFLVSFSGSNLKKLNIKSEITPIINIQGSAKLSKKPHIRYCKKTDSWLAFFYVKPDNKNPLSQPINIMCYLTLGGKRLSETWTYLWYPIVKQTIIYQ
ncbi:MAG TPA: glucan biosynthesis protein [Victivallales bacterium]|nr:glucan biosynthesis protein [Victivallales bacterium]